jgi:hypothetical protein
MVTMVLHSTPALVAASAANDTAPRVPLPSDSASSPEIVSKIAFFAFAVSFLKASGLESSTCGRYEATMERPPTRRSMPAGVRTHPGRVTPRLGLGLPRVASRRFE